MLRSFIEDTIELSSLAALLCCIAFVAHLGSGF